MEMLLQFPKSTHELDTIKENLNIYYRFDVETKQECLIGTEYKIENNPEMFHSGYPTEKTVPLGTLLSKCVYSLHSIFYMLERSPKTIYDKIITLVLNRDFPDTKEIDDNIDTLACLLMIDFYQPDFQNSKIFEKLSRYISFIDACSKNRELCKLENLEHFVAMNADTLKQSENILFNLHIDEISRKVASSEIRELLEKRQRKENQLTEALNVLGNVTGKDFGYTYKNKLSFHFHYYPIRSVLDFMIASLQEVFTAHKVINRCQHCGKCFVTQHRSDERYCRISSPFNPLKTCGEQEKLMKQLERERSIECKKIEKRIRVKLSNRKDVNNVELQKIRKLTVDQFTNEAYDFRQSILNEEHTEEEYIAWLNDFYARRNQIDEQNRKKLGL